MNREEFEKKFAEVREKAVELDRAIKEAKRIKKIEEKRQQQEQTSPDVAPADLLERYERIITNGTALERAILYLRNFDMEENFGSSLLKAKQKARLRATFKNKKDRDVVGEIGHLYDELARYTRYYLYTTQKLWQEIANRTLILCQKWEDADRLADVITRTYYTQILPLKVEVSGESAYSEEEFTKYVSKVWTKAESRDGITPKIESSGADKQGRPLFKVVANVDGKKGLYSQIEELREDAENALSLLRGAVEPFSNFMLSNIPLQTGGSIFPYTTIQPQAAEQILDFPDQLPAMREAAMGKYFAYRLRQRREAGETITPEEEKRAVIPDYNQAEDSIHYIESGKRNLFKFIPDHYDPKRDYEKES